MYVCYVCTNGTRVCMYAILSCSVVLMHPHALRLVLVIGDRWRVHPRVARQHPALRQGVGDSVVNTQLTATGRSAAPRSSAVLSPGRHLGSLNSGLSTSALWSLRVMQWRRRRVSCLGEGRRPELSPLAISLRACTVGYYDSAGTCTTVGELQVAIVHGQAKHARWGCVHEQ